MAKLVQETFDDITGIGGRDACHVSNQGSQKIEVISFAPSPVGNIQIACSGRESLFIRKDDFKHVVDWLRSWGYM